MTCQLMHQSCITKGVANNMICISQVIWWVAPFEERNSTYLYVHVDIKCPSNSVNHLNAVLVRTIRYLCTFTVYMPVIFVLLLLGVWTRCDSLGGPNICCCINTSGHFCEDLTHKISKIKPPQKFQLS